MRPWRLLVALLLCALLLPAAVSTAQAQPKTAERGRVSGSIVGAPEGVKLEGTRVVLVQFKLDEQGQPKGSPVETSTADAKGKYAFNNVPVAGQTVYQVGATVNGQLVGSQPFTFPEGKLHVSLNLQYPHLVSDGSAVHIEQGLIAVEPRRGAVLITEVLHLLNPGPDVIEGVQHPLELNLPSGAEHLEVIREIQQSNGHERLGSKLLFYGNLEPGATTIAYRYTLPVWLGTVKLHKEYPHPVDNLSVLTPHDSLRMDTARFEAKEPQTIQGSRYDSWVATDIAALTPVSLRMSGVPVPQQVYLVPTAGFVLLMVGMVGWFMLRRLPRGDGDDEDSA
ncbi:MAG TPA: hypothetical protein VKB51_11935 [bacterium]|nr:hypothetical protein [bacterium]